MLLEGRLDFGTAGNLLELKTITELNNGGSLKCVKLIRDDKTKNWGEENPQQLPPKLPAIICEHDENNGSIFTFANEKSGSSWYAVMLPPWFPLVDVLVGFVGAVVRFFVVARAWLNEVIWSCDAFY